MKQAMINYIQAPRNDELYTPRYAVEPLLRFIPKEWIIWECTDFGGSIITEVLQERGNKVISSHINEGKDFFSFEPENYDCIITNPPYSIKDKFLNRCYELNKPFALLLPLTALEGKSRGQMYRRNGIEILVLDGRVNFMVDKKSVWFNTSWFCKGILPNDLMFGQLNK